MHAEMCWDINYIQITHTCGTQRTGGHVQEKNLTPVSESSGSTPLMSSAFPLACNTAMALFSIHVSIPLNSAGKGGRGSREGEGRGERRERRRGKGERSREGEGRGERREGRRGKGERSREGEGRGERREGRRGKGERSREGEGREKGGEKGGEGK